MAQLVGWVVPITVRGDFLNEFTRIDDWVPPTTAIVASLGIIVASKSFDPPAYLIVRLGLVYQVVISYSFTVCWRGLPR